MALVTITIRDGEDGAVNISLESEPPLDLTDDGVLTDAQFCAMNFLNDTVQDAETVHSVSAS